jgi:uncharacterized membrane protein
VIRRRQPGQVVALFAAVLLPAIVLGLGLVVDTALVFKARREALALADAAAEYGAAHVDHESKRAHPELPAPIDIMLAESKAQQYVVQHRPSAVVTATATTQRVHVSVVVQATTLIWHLPGESTVAIQAVADAQPFTGVATGQAP